MQNFAETSSSLQNLHPYVFITVLGGLFIGSLILVVLSALVANRMARRQAEKVRESRINEAVVAHKPPLGLSPAEIGYLYDMRCSHNEIIATLFEIEQRGIIRIVDHNTIQVINDANYVDLHEFEKIAIRFMNGDTATAEKTRQISVTYTDPYTGEAAPYLVEIPTKKNVTEFLRAVQEALTEKNIPTVNYTGAFFVRAAIVTLVLLVASVVAFGVLGIFKDVASLLLAGGLAFMPLYAAEALALVWLWANIAGRHTFDTHEARALWPVLEGYKLFLQHESVESGESAAKSLPYAMIFGLEAKWRQLLTAKSSISTPV
jgi:hypothetical protein